RMRAKLRAVRDGLRARLHVPRDDVGRWLGQVVAGYYRYFAVPRNYPALSLFRYEVVRLWCQALRRRSQKSRITWARMLRWAGQWIPQPRIMHPYPEQRLLVMTQGRSPVR
ncbi:MAG: hypothetical protein KC729_22050, partial [Candidatus Eisenbacteria bacterium]|nr:hypothetical protein [Candidatus Eisenbacteria bacterium]